MSFENKIADKLNEVSMKPSSDIMSLVRKKRTPFYVFKNHLKLHKVRYGAVAILGLLALSAPFVLDTNKGETSIVRNTTTTTTTTTTTQIDINEPIVSKELDIENGVSQFETIHSIETKNEGRNSKEEFSKNNISKLIKSSSTGSEISGKSGNKASTISGGIKVEGSDGDINDNEVFVNKGNKGVKVDAVQKVSNKDIRNLEQQEFLQSDPISIEIVNLEYLANNLEIEDRSVPMMPDGPVSDLRKVGVVFVGVGAGYYLDNVTYGNSAISNKMKESTSLRSSNSYGINIGLSLYKKWTLQTGVEMFTRKEDFTYLELSENYILHIDTVKGKVHIPGEPDKEVIRYDSSYLSDGNHKRITTLNKTSYIEIPVVFSYNIWNSNKLKVGANPGLRLGLFQSQSGLTLNNAYEPVQLKGEGSITQYKSLTISAELGLDFDYKIGRRVNLFVQPKVRTGLGNLMDSKVGYNKNYTIFGVFGGVRCQLN